MWKSSKVLAVAMAIIMVVGCNAATIQAYINLAVNIALQVAVLAGASRATADKVTGDLAIAQKLITDFNAASKAAQPGIASQIDAELNVAQADLNDILTGMRIMDPKIQAVVRASIAIGITAIESIRALALKNAPAPVKAMLRATLPGAIAPKGKISSPDQLKALYNKTVADYPSAQLR